MNLDYVSYAVIVVGVFTAYMAMVHLFRRDRLQDRLQNVAVSGFTPDDDEDDAPPLTAVFCAKVVSLMGVGPAIRKEAAGSLAQAGITSPFAPDYFLFFKRIMQPIILVLGVVLFIKLVVMPPDAGFLVKGAYFLIALIVIGVGLFGANLYVANCKQRRQQVLMRSFPEALDLLLVCIESGLGLDAALGRVCQEMRSTLPVITSELDRTRVELTIMSDRTQALQNLAERTQIIPIKSLVSSLIQTEKFGTSLVDTLRVLSDDMRTTRLLNAENRAARIPVLITIPLILCILPAFIMIILGPPIVRVQDQGGIFGSATPGK